MKELSPKQVKINDPFWVSRLFVNADHSIFHQWRMLEASGCIDNFRIAAGEKEGFRTGWFFADSDAYKWLDAAARIERHRHDPNLCALMDDFIGLLGRVQMADGYLYTYNQLLFPGVRWKNLQIEHELYCHGHLIEAGVSHFQATGKQEMLIIARKAADLLVGDFTGAGSLATPGHEEIELALLRLYEVTGQVLYRDLAVHFLEQRGRTPFFGLFLLRQFISNGRREKAVAEKRAAYAAAHSGVTIPAIPAMNEAKHPPFSQLRYFLSGLSGKYFQQHTPIRRQTVPVGHAVRFGYLETAAAMAARDREDPVLLRTMEKAWERMVTRRMDVTGGLGALPDIEGFGRDYELEPETAYNETCAAIASLYWNWQLACLTGDARYSDLFEWQLYNAVLVGESHNGGGYFYNNPTMSRGGISRQEWYSVPCCPSNISRTLAEIGGYVCTFDPGNIWLQQYIGSTAQLGGPGGVRLEIESTLPYDGRVTVRLDCPRPTGMTLWLRKPSWAGEFTVEVDGKQIVIVGAAGKTGGTTACGVDPRLASFVPIRCTWQGKEEIIIRMEMPVRVLRPHTNVKALRGRVAISRGALVYCLESTDNPDVDIFGCRVDVDSLKYEFREGIFNGTGVIQAISADKKPLAFIPYHLWGNRGSSGMTVWVNTQEPK